MMKTINLILMSMLIMVFSSCGERADSKKEAALDGKWLTTQVWEDDGTQTYMVRTYTFDCLDNSFVMEDECSISVGSVNRHLGSVIVRGHYSVQGGQLVLDWDNEDVEIGYVDELVAEMGGKSGVIEAYESEKGASQIKRISKKEELVLIDMEGKDFILHYVD